MMTLRLIWALLKKNMLHAHWSGGFFLMTLGLAVSVIDWKFPLRESGWTEVLFGVWIFSLSIGLTTFSVDLKRDNIRFLNYLPVRRSHIWLANYADGFLSLAVLLVTLLWRRTFFFEPGIESDSTLLASRWNLPMSIGFVSFWCYSFGAFCRVLFERDLVATAIAASASSLLWIGGDMLLKRVMALFPSFVDLAPVLWLSGVLFASAGFLLFVFVQPRYPRWVQGLAFGVPVWLMIVLVGTIHLYLSALRWKELSANEKLRIFDVARLPGKPERLLAVVASDRSLQHTVSIDVETERYHDLGRDLSWFAASRSDPMTIFAGNSGLLSFQAQRAPNGLFPIPPSIVLVSPEGNGLEQIIATRAFNCRWSADARFVVYVEARHDDPGSRNGKTAGSERSTLLAVVNRSGKVLSRLPISSRANRFHLSPSGRVLAVAPLAGEEKAKHDAESPTYILLDLATQTQTRFQLPGTVMSFAPDLKRAACLRTQIREGRQFQSVVVVDLETKAEQQLFSEQEIPSVMVDDKVAAQVGRAVATSPSLWVDSFSDSPRWLQLPTLMFNAKFDRAVTVLRELQGDMFAYSIVVVDVASGQKRVLVPPSELPKHSVTTGLGSYSLLLFFGFLPNDSQLAYKLGNTLYLLDTSSGERTVLAKTSPEAGGEYSGEFHFSPSRQQVVYQTYTRVAPGQGSSKLERCSAEQSQILHFSKSDISQASWLDEEQITFVENDRLFVIRADGTGLRQMFPPRH